jgi:hypothetical protein
MIPITAPDRGFNVARHEGVLQSSRLRLLKRLSSHPSVLSATPPMIMYKTVIDFFSYFKYISFGAKMERSCLYILSL